MPVGSLVCAAVFSCLADHAALGKWIPIGQEDSVIHPPPDVSGEIAIGMTRVIASKGEISLNEEVVQRSATIKVNRSGLRNSQQTMTSSR